MIKQNGNGLVILIILMLAYQYAPEIESIETEPVTDPTIYGCTDSNANNYDPNANQDDGSCTYTTPPPTVYGCTDPNADNYDPNANQDDGSCTYSQTTVYGCTDPNADNYDPNANQDDGSCTYSGGGGGSSPQCSDGADNDGDGPIDSEDPDCYFDDPNEGMIYCPNWIDEGFAPPSREECEGI